MQLFRHVPTLADFSCKLRNAKKVRLLPSYTLHHGKLGEQHIKYHKNQGKGVKEILIGQRVSEVAGGNYKLAIPKNKGREVGKRFLFAILRIRDVYPGSRTEFFSILDPGSNKKKSRNK